jgi:HD superfamily phosphohydrolase
MGKHVHEIRDAVHVFDHLGSEERKVLDSRPFQRLRHIHQLAMTYLVYPGATHRRFEHSLGVMELADRVFRTITSEDNIDDRVRKLFPKGARHTYWHLILRMAALCHDLGHLPFSHAAEKDLLPEGMTHERMSVEFILSSQMNDIWRSMEPPLKPHDIAKLAVGPDKYPKDYDHAEFSEWERILSEIIIGDSFGVDRMDYLLRDSLHAGVVYGRFDQYRLIDTLRVLPESDDATTPVLGIEAGGLESAEALLLARYFMYSQVYFHPVRRAYDLHLQDFLIKWFGRNGMPIELDAFLQLSDEEVMVEIRRAVVDHEHIGHDDAKRIIDRQHFKVLYERNPNDFKKNLDAAKAIFDASKTAFGEENVKLDSYRQKRSGTNFPVRFRDSRIVSSVAESDVLQNVPVVAIDYVFIAPEVREDASRWLAENRERVIAEHVVEGGDE